MTDKIDDLDSFDFDPSVVDDSSVAPIEVDTRMTPLETVQEKQTSYIKTISYR